MLEHSQEERFSNMRRWGAGCLQTGKSGSERGCRVIPKRDIRSLLYCFGYFRLVERLSRGEARLSELLASQELYDNHFLESAVWQAARASAHRHE